MKTTKVVLQIGSQLSIEHITRLKSDPAAFVMLLNHVLIEHALPRDDILVFNARQSWIIGKTAPPFHQFKELPLFPIISRCLLR